MTDVEAILYLQNLQIQTLVEISNEIQDIRKEIRAIRKNQEDIAILQASILHILQEDYEELPPVSLN
jgi:hypothetical protein